MITALSWVPKGAAKAVPVQAEFPSEEIEELKESCDQIYVEDEEENGEVAHAKAVAEEFGKSSKSKNTSSSMAVDDEATDGLQELDMDNYDEEDDGMYLAYHVFS